MLRCPTSPSPSFEPLSELGLSFPAAPVSSGPDTWPLNPACSSQGGCDLCAREVGGKEPGGLLLDSSIPLQTALGLEGHPGSVIFPFVVDQQIAVLPCGYPVPGPEIPHQNPEDPTSQSEGLPGWKAVGSRVRALECVP